MALLVTSNYDTPIGTTLTSTYWRWVGMGIDVPANQTLVTLYGYVDQAAYDTKKQNIGQKQYSIKDADFAALVLQPPTGATISDAISNAVYAYVKANDPFFTDAQGV